MNVLQDQIENALREMLPEDVAISVEPIGGDHGLMPVEDEAVAKAIEKRRFEFAAGRRAARLALGEDVAIPKGAHREPVWPDTIVGTIAHDQGWAVSAVGESARYSGLGLDLTEVAPLEEKLWKSIFALKDWPQSGLHARAGFAAKEALYKALYPAHRAFFGFQAANVEIDLERGAFNASLTGDLPPFVQGQTFTGKIAIVENLLIAGLSVSK